MTFTLETAARLAFTATATDAVKFSVSQDVNGKLKAVAKGNVKAGATVQTKDVLLEAGTYYLTMESTTAKKGGSTDYSVGIAEGASFFPAGNNSDDKWQDVAEAAPVADGGNIAGWVGYGDAVDFTKFHVNDDGQIELKLDDATQAAFASKQIKLSCISAETGKAVALTGLSNGTVNSRKAVTAGDYYLGVQCSNVKKYDTTYGITAGSLAAV